MATKDEEARRQARFVAQAATALARVRGSLSEQSVLAIKSAYGALLLHNETARRNQVCGALLGFTRIPHENPVEAIRSFLQGLDPDRPTGRGASTRTIREALEAWKRTPGQRKPKADSLNKWQATAKLIKESGLGSVDPDTLRKGWNRRVSK